MAFLVMDLSLRGRRDLADRFAQAYFDAAGDPDGREVLSFYAAYRALVRGKVEGLKSLAPEVPAAERAKALASARRHWLFALAELETPSRRPCLVLVVGVPGTGKSTLARGLAGDAGMEVIRTDVVRKELAGLEPERDRAASGHYGPEWNDRTYAECLRRAEQSVARGGRVIVDGNFLKRKLRREFLDMASRLGAASAVIACTVDAQTAQRRIEGRVGDASDADAAIHHLAASRWEPPGADEAARVLDTSGTPESARAKAMAFLESLGLAGGAPLHVPDTPA
jgi:hypothetical protein